MEPQCPGYCGLQSMQKAFASDAFNVCRCAIFSEVWKLSHAPPPAPPPPVPQSPSPPHPPRTRFLAVVKGHLRTFWCLRFLSMGSICHRIANIAFPALVPGSLTTAEAEALQLFGSRSAVQLCCFGDRGLSAGCSQSKAPRASERI